MSNKDSIKDLYYTFGKNFLDASIIYIPENILILIEKLDLSSKAWSKFTNKVFVFEENGNNYFVEDELVSVKIMQKKYLLENNIFHLLKLKEEFLPITFYYILKKYNEQLNAYIRISRWLSDNTVNLLDLTDDQKTAFKIQNQAFMTHHIEMIDVFGDFYKVISKKGLSRKSDNIQETLKFVLESQPGISFTTIVNNETNPISNRKIKMSNVRELTKSYADELILKQIFNLDINAI